MPAKPISLGPWMGIDNVHSPDARTFQPPGELEKRLPALVAATDVDLDDDGWAASRRPLGSVLELLSGKTIISFGNLLLIQDSSRLSLLDPVTLTSVGLVAGLSAQVQTCRHAAQLFWSDGVKVGRITAADTALNWGCDICPTPTLTAGNGSLSAGSYLVAGSFVDASGIVHASDQAASGVLAATGGITVSFGTLDANATHVRVWMAGPDDDVLYMVKDVPVGSLPYTIMDPPAEDTVCWTVGMSPPVSCDFIFSYQDRLMLVEDSWIYPSVGAAHHLYDLGTSAVARPETILAAGGLADGFWTVSAQGAYWTSGLEIANWRTVDQRQVCEFCAGSLVTNAAALTGLGLNGSVPVVLFWCEWGLAIGLPDGQMLFPTKQRYNMAVTGKCARFAFVQQNDLKQLVVVVE